MPADAAIASTAGDHGAQFLPSRIAVPRNRAPKTARQPFWAVVTQLSTCNRQAGSLCDGLATNMSLGNGPQTWNMIQNAQTIVLICASAK